MASPPKILDLARLRAMYASGTFGPLDLADAIATRMAASDDPAIFISAVDHAGLRRQAEDLLALASAPNSLPLWGIPFAVKDNIDVAGLPTTAACPAFAYRPARDAFVVARLRAAGAFVIGKTNLDQFATGLNGTRSPHGAPRCVFDKAYISGGSSSGSAVSVAAGLASFALGTDTAGSGRVPAAFNNIVGIKPTPGRLSTQGLVPACRSLDCISIFAANVPDGVAIRRVAEGFDPDDPFSNARPASPLTHTPPTIGILRDADRAFFGDDASAALYAAAIDAAQALGARVIPFDYAPFRETAALLYKGPWVAERLAALEAFLATNAADVEPSVRGILESAKPYSAVDAFRGHYALEALKRRTGATWAEVDMLMLPTAPTIYTVAAMLADPIALNSNLGHYTNFANLMGLAAIAVPAGFRADGLPFGITLVGPGGADDALAPMSDALHRRLGAGMGVDRAAPLPSPAAPTSDRRLRIAVVGAHLSGMPLNHQLTDRGAMLICPATTARDYKLYALPGTSPPKPGLVRAPGFAGPGIAIEIWALDPEAFGTFVAAIPAPLGIGTLTLADGTMVQGFLCETHATAGADDITDHGGWRAYRAGAA